MVKNKSSYFFARVITDTNLYKVKVSELEEFKYGAEVIINTEFGQDIAVITSWKTNIEDNGPKSYESGSFIRYCSQEDKIKRKNLDKKSIELKRQIKALIDSFKLKMNLTHVLVPLSDNSICIFYTAQERVDFRALLAELRGKYKVKIIFRHINNNERSSAFLFASDLSLYKRQSTHY